MEEGYYIHKLGDELGVQIKGPSEKELFSRALSGLAALIRPDLAPKTKPVSVRAHIHGNKLSDTLERFLQHVLFESDMHHAVFSGMDIIELSPEEIECELHGREINHREEELVSIRVAGIEKHAYGWEAELKPIFL